MSSTEKRRYKGNSEILHDMVMERLDRYICKENYSRTPLVKMDNVESETKTGELGESPTNSEGLEIVM